MSAHLRIMGYDTDTVFNAEFLMLDIDTNQVTLSSDDNAQLGTASISTSNDTPYLIHAHVFGSTVIVRRGQLGQPLETVLSIDNAPAQATDRFILSTSSACIVDDVNIGHFEMEYEYDALGRRIEKRTGGDATRYIYDGARVAEEWAISGSPALAASYVYGLYIDEVLTMRRGGDDYCYHGDDMHNVVKLTDEDGEVIEAYDYADCGQPGFYDATGALLDVSASRFGNPYLFSGREWDPELGYYHFRNRYMNPGLGRFVSRDPLGMWGDPLNLGNGYTYAASNPWSLVDPFGLESGGNLIDWAKGIWGSWMRNDVPTENYGQGEDIDAALSRLASECRQAGNDVVDNYFLDGDPLDKSSREFLSAAGTDAKAHLIEGAADAAENGAYNGAAIVGGIGAGKAIEEGLEKAKSTGAWGKVKNWFKEWWGEKPASSPSTVPHRDRLPEGVGPYQLELFPPEAFDRNRHYGRSPTAEQRNSVPMGMEFDHDPTLVQHYYEGVGQGGLPGYNLTEGERRAYAASLDSGRAATPAQQRKQGGSASAYSKQKKKDYGL